MNALPQAESGVAEKLLPLLTMALENALQDPPLGMRRLKHM